MNNRNVMPSKSIEELIVWQKTESTKYNVYEKEEIPEFILAKYKLVGEKIALSLADNKCENCGTPTRGIHHLIQRPNRRFIKYGKYFFQRNYFYNLAILCSNCHWNVEKELKRGRKK